MRLNKSTSHAVRILIDCAKAEGRLIKVAEIAKRLDITQQNAFKIVHLLSKAGFLASVRGRHGGVRLARPAAKIRIGDVVRSIETMGRDGRRRPAAAAACTASSTTPWTPSSASSTSTRLKTWPKHTRCRRRASRAGGRARRTLRGPAPRTRRGGQQSAPVRPIG